MSGVLKFCPSCGVKLPGATAFCQECGHALGPAKAVQEKGPEVKIQVQQQAAQGGNKKGRSLVGNNSPSSYFYKDSENTIPWASEEWPPRMSGIWFPFCLLVWGFPLGCLGIVPDPLGRGLTLSLTAIVSLAGFDASNHAVAMLG